MAVNISKTIQNFAAKIDRRCQSVKNWVVKTAEMVIFQKLIICNLHEHPKSPFQNMRKISPRNLKLLPCFFSCLHLSEMALGDMESSKQGRLYWNFCTFCGRAVTSMSPGGPNKDTTLTPGANRCERLWPLFSVTKQHQSVPSRPLSGILLVMKFGGGFFANPPWFLFGRFQDFEKSWFSLLRFWSELIGPFCYFSQFFQL